MVLTGQFSSGKSKLITALTDRAVEPASDADIATDTVTSYPWDGAVVLVDTPGVQSGLRSHDDLALSAIGDADFILFVIHVGLFDDASRDFLRHLANDLQLFGQMIVVITQVGKQAAAPGIRQQAVKAALGTTTFNLPVVEVDSVDYLRSLEGGPRAEAFRTRSGIDDLRATINQISEDRGELARLRQPLHLTRQLCDEAQGLFIADERARLALSLLASQRSAVSERRLMIEKTFRTSEADFKSSSLVDVKAFVDRATSLPEDSDNAQQVLAGAETRLVEALERHADAFGRSIARLAESQFDKLDEQLIEIGDSNRATQLDRPVGDVNLAAPDSFGTVDGRPPGGGPRPSLDWRSASKQIKNSRAWWGAGDGVRSAAGSNGHQIVLDIGHRFGKKFKPWEAVKIADKVGKAAKVGGFVIQIGGAGYDVWKNERDAHRAQIESERQHSAFVTEMMGYADRIAADARNQLWSIVDPPLDAFLAEVTSAQDQIIRSEGVRNDAVAELDAIAGEADRLLGLSS
ncbi:GTPase [Aeromicrobium stalagmiti]|uniref:GTPase n=1 Tax=Aeromicrobium stalagmiti TaxID=2738988 RepID=UPI00156801E5|nr:GTPase [Aeromicrobium stalagmiti]NRQ50406.1 dynamin family protein [Aeromicrobium stalagmiti]